MDLHDLQTLLGLLSATPGVVLLIAAYFYWIIKRVREDFDEFKKQYREDMDAIHNNGFVRKDVLAESQDAIHDRVERIEDWIDDHAK